MRPCGAHGIGPIHRRACQCAGLGDGNKTLAEKWSVDVSGYWNPISTESLRANILAATVGVRRWRFEPHVGLFWGLHSTLAKYKVGNRRNC